MTSDQQHAGYAPGFLADLFTDRKEFDAFGGAMETFADGGTKLDVYDRVDVYSEAKLRPLLDRWEAAGVYTQEGCGDYDPEPGLTIYRALQDRPDAFFESLDQPTAGDGRFGRDGPGDVLAGQAWEALRLFANEQRADAMEALLDDAETIYDTDLDPWVRPTRNEYDTRGILEDGRLTAVGRDIVRTYQRLRDEYGLTPATLDAVTSWERDGDTVVAFLALVDEIDSVPLLADRIDVSTSALYAWTGAYREAGLLENVDGSSLAHDADGFAEDLLGALEELGEALYEQRLRDGMAYVFGPPGPAQQEVAPDRRADERVEDSAAPSGADDSPLERDAEAPEEQRHVATVELPDDEVTFGSEAQIEILGRIHEATATGGGRGAEVGTLQVEADGVAVLDELEALDAKGLVRTGPDGRERTTEKGARVADRLDS